MTRRNVEPARRWRDVAKCGARGERRRAAGLCSPPLLDECWTTSFGPAPLREAADTAIATIAGELAAHDLPRKVLLCTFDALTTQITREALAGFAWQAGS